jgi:hypothetical protein
MNPSSHCKWLRRSAAVVALMLGCAAAVANQDDPGPQTAWVPTTLEELECLSPCQLEDLYRRSEVGRPLVGVADGRMLCVTDARLPKVRLRLARTFWRGKGACEDGCFTNRWVGGVDAITSRYVIGPSWIDGKPAVLMDYPPKTPLLGNVHDELREVSPGLYLGPLFQVRPCPKLQGFLGLKLIPCQAQKGCPEGGCRRW